jgi:hypothetical protein
MQIEVTGETERLIQAALASGRYASAEEFIAAMANDWKGKHPGVSVLPAMPQRIDLPTLLDNQNVKPCQDPKSLETDLWPKDESPDEFLTFLREIRVDHASAVERL